MKKNAKLLILAEVCRQRLEILNTATSTHEVKSNKDPIEENLDPIIPAKNTRITNLKTIIKLNKCLCKNVIKHHNQGLQEKNNANNDILLKLTDTNKNKMMDQIPIITNANKEPKYAEMKKQLIRTNTDVLKCNTMQIHIYESEFVRQKGNIYNISRKKGNLIMKIQHDVSSSCKNALIRTILVQKDSTYREYPINQICAKHRIESRPDLQEHMLQATNRAESFYYKGRNTKKSIYFKINNKFQSVIGLKFYFNNTCNTTKGILKLPHKITNTLLVVTLEEDGIIKAKQSIEIYVKNNVKNN